MSDSVSLDRGRIRLGGLLIYLEHCLAPEAPLDRGAPEAPLDPGVVPRAYGVAPTFVTTAGEVLAAVGPGEAVWLGFSAVDGVVRVRVMVDDEPLEELTIPPASRLDAVFTAPQRLLVILVDPPGPTADIRLVTPDVWAELTGRTPPPLDLTRGYTGWAAP